MIGTGTRTYTCITVQLRFKCLKLRCTFLKDSEPPSQIFVTYNQLFFSSWRVIYILNVEQEMG